MDSVENLHEKRIKEILLILEVKYLKELKKYADIGGKKKKLPRKKRKEIRKQLLKKIKKSTFESNDSDCDSDPKKDDPTFPSKAYTKMKKCFAQYIEPGADSDITLKNPLDKNSFIIGCSDQREDEQTHDKCLQLLGTNQLFQLRDLKDFKVCMDDLVRIFFILSDQVNMDKKFLSWSQKKKYIMERIMGYWYLVNDQEMDLWNRSFMANVADSAKRKEMSLLLNDLNCSSGPNVSINEVIKHHSYKTQNGEFIGLDLCSNIMVRQAMVDIHDLVKVDNCTECRKLHYVCDKIIDLSLNYMRHFHSHFLEIFVYFVLKYFLNKKKLEKVKLTDMHDHEKLKSLEKNGEIFKFVIGFCFRNVIHFRYEPQNFENLEPLIPLVSLEFKQLIKVQ